VVEAVEDQDELLGTGRVVRTACRQPRSQFTRIGARVAMSDAPERLRVVAEHVVHERLGGTPVIDPFGRALIDQRQKVVVSDNWDAARPEIFEQLTCIGALARAGARGQYGHAPRAVQEALDQLLVERGRREDIIRGNLVALGQRLQLIPVLRPLHVR
jgi:hypothetical protein